MEDKKTENEVRSGEAAVAAGECDEAETRAGAAAAGGYDSPRRTIPVEDERSANITQPDIGGAAGADEDGVDRKDGDRITSQEAREGAGPFTGTGNQDALRTAGRQGASDANFADQRTVEADSKENTNKEADKATKEDAKEQLAQRERDSES